MSAQAAAHENMKFRSQKAVPKEAPAPKKKLPNISKERSKNYRKGAIVSCDRVVFPCRVSVVCSRFARSFRVSVPRFCFVGPSRAVVSRLRLAFGLVFPLRGFVPRCRFVSLFRVWVSRVCFVFPLRAFRAALSASRFPRRAFCAALFASRFPRYAAGSRVRFAVSRCRSAGSSHAAVSRVRFTCSFRVFALCFRVAFPFCVFVLCPRFAFPASRFQSASSFHVFVLRFLFVLAKRARRARGRPCA